MSTEEKILFFNPYLLQEKIALPLFEQDINAITPVARVEIADAEKRVALPVVAMMVGIEASGFISGKEIAEHHLCLRATAGTLAIVDGNFHDIIHVTDNAGHVSRAKSGIDRVYGRTLSPDTTATST